MKPGFGNIQNTFSLSRWTTPKDIVLTEITGGIRISFTPIAGTETEIWCAVNGGTLYIVTICGIGVTSYDWIVDSGADFAFELRSKKDTTILNVPINFAIAIVGGAVRITWVDNNSEAEYFEVVGDIGSGYTLLGTVAAGVQLLDYYLPTAGGVNIVCKVRAKEGTVPVYSSYTNPSESLFIPIMDRDGNIYTEVTIGSKVFLKGNLKTTKFRNGDVIENATASGSSIHQWSYSATPAYCWWANDIAYKAAWGALYNRNAYTDARGICPIGYHVPTDAEITQMISDLGGASVAGGHAKITGTTYWTTQNADNSSGLGLVGAGFRHESNGNFSLMKGYGQYAAISTMFYMIDANTTITLLACSNLRGLSVCCIKD